MFVHFKIQATFYILINTEDSEAINLSKLLQILTSLSIMAFDSIYLVIMILGYVVIKIAISFNHIALQFLTYVSY